MAVNVFERYHRIVDHARESQRHASQDHGVDRPAHQRQHHKRRQCGQRNRQQHRRRGAEAAQKNQDHQAGEDQPEKAFVQHRIDCFFHVHGLIEDNAGLHLLRDVIQVLDELTHAIHHRDGVGVAALLHDGNVGGALPIDANDVVLDLVRVLRFAYIVYRDPRVALYFERKFAQLLHVVDEAVGVNKVVVGPHLHVARGQNQVGVVDCAHHIHDA